MNRVRLIKNLSNNHLLAICIGLVYLWFGTLKFFPGKSPAEQLAKDTINIITFGLIPPALSIVLLAVWEFSVAVLLILYRWKKLGLTLAIIHMTLTFTPLFVLPDLSFSDAPIQPTLLGQYIFKNIVFLAILLILYRNQHTQQKAD